MDDKNNILQELRQAYISKYLQLKVRLTGLSLRACATHANIPYSTLGSMIHKPLGAGVNNMMRFCEVLGINVDILSFMIDAIVVPSEKGKHDFSLWEFDKLNNDQIEIAKDLYIKTNERFLFEVYSCLEDGYLNDPSSPYKFKPEIFNIASKIDSNVDRAPYIKNILETLNRLSDEELALALRLLNAIKSPNV